MYKARNYETVNMLLQNPTLWNKGMIKKTLQQFKKSNSNVGRVFNTLDVQEIIKNYLLTLSDAMKKEESARKERKNEDSLPDFSHVLVSGI
jgi:hypothetical protein